MNPLVFVFPLPPNLANARMHWRTKLVARQAYEHHCYGLVLIKQLPARPAKPIARATITAHLVVGAMMDEDNAVARCKWPLDFLVKAGYLADDRRKCLKWSEFPTMAVKRKKTSLTLTLTPVENVE